MSKLSVATSEPESDRESESDPNPLRLAFKLDSGTGIRLSEDGTVTYFAAGIKVTREVYLDVLQTVRVTSRDLEDLFFGLTDFFQEGIKQAFEEIMRKGQVEVEPA